MNKNLFMDFEKIVNNFNKNYFFKEFTYAVNKAKDKNKQEYQVGDCIVSLDDILLIFQIKERDVSISALEAEEKWFNNKILKQAKNQIKSSCNYFLNEKKIKLKNIRNHEFDLSIESVKQLYKIILYRSNNFLSEKYKKIKYYQSTTIGIIHIIEADAYRSIVETLITPSEIAEYLRFREQLIKSWQTGVNDLSEDALIGQYLSGNHSEPPSNKFTEYFVSIKHNLDEWNILGLLHVFQERIISGNDEVSHDYYLILKEIAKLQRHELKEFKRRYVEALNFSHLDKVTLPFRMAIPRLDCGFIFIPLIKTDKEQDRGRGLLEAYTTLHKYDQRLHKCIGVTVFAEENGWHSLEWCYLNHPWREDPEISRLLVDAFPFEKANLKEVDRYEFIESDITSKLTEENLQG